jgi:hypothetical protein
MKQHIVPRFYLEAFVDPATPEGHEPSLWECDLPAGRVRRHAPRNAATGPDYYSAVRDDGTKDDRAELLLGRVESDAAPVIRKVREGHFSLSEDDRVYLACFLSFLLVRIPAFRDRVHAPGERIATAMMRAHASHREYFEEHYIRKIRERGLEMTPEEAEEFRQAMMQATMRPSPEFSLSHALNAFRMPAFLMFDMQWTFLRSSGGAPFITGDTPVTKRNPKVKAPHTAGLILADTEVTFPVSPSVCLRAHWSKDDPAVADISEDEVADINRERVRYAVKRVFASSEKAVRAALDVYVELLEAGEAHARTVNLMLIEGDEPPTPV